MQTAQLEGPTRPVKPEDKQWTEVKREHGVTRRVRNAMTRGAEHVEGRAAELGADTNGFGSNLSIGVVIAAVFGVVIVRQMLADTSISASLEPLDLLVLTFIPVVLLLKKTGIIGNKS